MNENRVQAEQVAELLNNAETQETIFWGKELVVSYRLPNGFTVFGRAACVDPANFDINVGRAIALENASSTVWMLLGYELAERLHLNARGVTT